MAKIVKRNLPNGVWQQLLPHALRILEDIKAHGTNELFWTLGGGTVLMFRYAHRLSKDIDIFVPDPQYLGFVTPRLSDVAAEVAAPNLTEYPYEFWEINGQEIRVETAVEIVAKKLWHRGDRATARDLFDLSLVIERESKQLLTATTLLQKNAKIFIEQIHSRQKVLKLQFDEIDVLDYRPSYEEAVRCSTLFLEKLL